MPFTAQVRFSGRSGIPEDVFINTFHFGGLANSTSTSNVHPKLVDFYNLDAGAQPTAIADFMSEIIDRVVPVEVRYFDKDVPGPSGPPFQTITFVLNPPGSVLFMPEEVAVVSSQVGGLVNGKPHRARQYLGPLTNAVISESAEGHAEVIPDLVDTIATAAKRLRDQLTTTLNPWSAMTETPTTILVTEIQSGFVDNAFDTQRRRGVTATARTNWVGA